jgi:hypothetical protein
MHTSIAYWRPLLFKGKADAAESRAAVELFVLEKRLPPLQWVEETIGTQMPWRERSLGKALEKLNKGDYVLVSRLIYLGKSIEECCEIMTSLAERQIFFYDLNSKCHIEQQEQFQYWQNAITALVDFRESLKSARSKSSGRDSTFEKTLEAYQDEILFLLHHGSSREFVAQRYSIPVSALSAWLVQQQ